jgi:hypothetical protein
MTLPDPKLGDEVTILVGNLSLLQKLNQRLLTLTFQHTQPW